MLLGWIRVVFEIGVDRSTRVQVGGVNDEVLVVCAGALAKIVTDLDLDVVDRGGSHVRSDQYQCEAQQCAVAIHQSALRSYQCNVTPGPQAIPSCLREPAQ